MRWRRAFVMGFGVVLAMAATIPSASADPAPSNPSEVARRIHDRGRYPNDLLVAPEPEGEAGGAGSGRTPIPIFGDRRAPAAPPDPDPFWLPDWDLEIPFLRELLALLGKGALAAIVIAIVAVVVAVIYLLVRIRRAGMADDSVPRKRSTKAEPATEASVDPLLAMPTLGHEELARLGRYREAAHALLVAALLSTGWAPEGRGRGLTAREIVGGYGKEAPPREPLVSLLSLVERVWFGGRDATAATYEEALRYFHAFVPREAP